MTTKPRRIDFSPDNFIAGITGILKPDEIGLYWLICSLIYSRGGAIEIDFGRWGKIAGGVSSRSVQAVFDRLTRHGMVRSDASGVMARGCEDKLKEATHRIHTAHENGLMGGRPSGKNKGLEKPDGLSSGSGGENRPAHPPPPSQPPPPKLVEEVIGDWNAPGDTNPQDQSRDLRSIQALVWRLAGLSVERIATRMTSASVEGHDVCRQFLAAMPVADALEFIERSWGASRSPIEYPWKWLPSVLAAELDRRSAAAGRTSTLTDSEHLLLAGIKLLIQVGSYAESHPPPAQWPAAVKAALNGAGDQAEAAWRVWLAKKPSSRRGAYLQHHGMLAQYRDLYRGGTDGVST